MQAGKLHAAAQAISEEFESRQIRAKLSELQAALATSVESPEDENTQKFQQHYEEAEKMLEECETNRAMPTRRMIFEQMGASQYIGRGLWEQISRIITENSIALANALQEMVKLNKRVDKFCKTVKTLHKNLHDLKVAEDRLGPGEARIGMAIPPGFVQSNMEGLGTEIHEFDDALKTFQKITGQEPASLEVRSIGSLDFELTLGVGPELASCVAMAVERIAGIYKNLFEIKKLRKDLVEQKVPEERIKAIEEHEAELVDKEVAELAEALLGEYCKNMEKGRKGDLKSALGRDLRFLADQIDHGVVIEVEAAPAKGAKAKDEELVEQINARGRALADLERAPEPIFTMPAEEGE